MRIDPLRGPAHRDNHTVTTVGRSTLYLVAASPCVACPVNTETYSSYFSLGVKWRFGFLVPARPPPAVTTFGFDTCNDLPAAQARRQAVS